MQRHPLLKNIRQRIREANRVHYMRWQDELRDLKLAHLKEKYPAAYEASGGDTMEIKPYSDKSANGLTRCIMDYLTYSGHYCNRINTQGQPRIKKIPRFNIFSRQIQHTEKVSYTKSMTRKGTADIDAIVYGIPVKIEVKVGKDTQSDYQKEEQERVEQSGGVYYIATDMQTFVAWFRKKFMR